MNKHDVVKALSKRLTLPQINAEDALKAVLILIGASLE
ncbi:MAG: hypothetical protein LEGION0398_MBIBDBAK_00330 [Legionellaceae bacterium]